jgi:ribonuclease P protein component
MRKRRAAPKFSHPPRGAWRKATGLGALLGLSLKIERLRTSKDFERVLSRSFVVHQGHFALHFLPECPSSWSSPQTKESAKAADAHSEAPTSSASAAAGVASNRPLRLCVGWVVPKRHARRSAMRSLIKREIRTAFAEAVDFLPVGIWVVRLKKPLLKAEFTSAQSLVLREHLQLELEALISSGGLLMRKRRSKNESSETEGLF